MRILNLKNKYESKLYLLDQDKLIFKLDCLCKDFQHRKIKKIGKNSDVKYYSEPCKHLKKSVDLLLKLGYKLKKQNNIGKTYVDAKLRKQILERSKGICEMNCNELATDYHRIIRGSNGGKYSLKNVKHLCNEHHKLVHANEF